MTKKILITGKNSYIGNQLADWLSNSSEIYSIEKLSVRGDNWKSQDFSEYDVIVHVAGIAHVSKDPKMEELYYKINRDLAVEVANKAKISNVKQFIFMSSIIVYGKDSNIGDRYVINDSTPFAPVDFYGKSKLEADLAIGNMNSNSFKTVIVRTPVVYGPNCKGNFPKLVKLAKFTPFFFRIYNERSMIYIDNLCEFLKLIVDSNSHGIFYPQNNEYVVTFEIIKKIGESVGHRIYFSVKLNGFLKKFSRKIPILNKVFGNKVYDKSLSKHFNNRYCVINFNESLEKIIREEK